MEPQSIDYRSTRRLNSEKYPDLPTTDIPSSYYTDPELFELERTKIFGRFWLLGGRVDALKESGDYFVREIEATRSSLLFVRGTDGEIRAFHNVCRHRANLVATGSGSCKFFSCKNHGWSYDTLGKLRSVPDKSQFHNLDQKQYGLIPVHCQIWNGFIFFCLDEAPRQTLLEQLDKLGEQFADYPFGDFREGGSWSSTIRCNWKLFQDVFQEAYHLKTVHAGTFPEVYTGPGNPFGRAGGFAIWGKNRSITMVFNPVYEQTPVEKIAGRLGPSLTATESAKSLSGTNWAKNEHYMFDLNGVFPNVLLDVADGFFFFHQFWPIDAQTTRWVGTLYMQPAVRPSQIISQEQSYILIRDAWREDMALGETLQRGMESGAVKYLPLSDSEIALRHSYEVVSGLLKKD